MPKYLDIAVNLIGSALESNLDDVISGADAAGVSPLIVIGSSLDESRAAMALCKTYPDKLYTTAGVHPHHASEWHEGSAAIQAELCQDTSVVAVGECGLDYNRDFSPRPKQREAFAAQLTLAAKLGKPVLMHERDAHEDFVAIVSEYRAELKGALLHCFTGTRKQMESYIELGLHLGITGWVCDERRGQELADLVKFIPGDRLLIETDSPYLLPRSMRPKPKSGKNLPQYLPYIAAEIARLRQEDERAFIERTYQNSLRFFQLGSRHD
ncbi:TatD family hydrolase [Shewanella sp.]|uniref:TatD family hydrolase n=1 Tax=Shewanella sp. TaxID=50422 RepID=UPI0035668BB4